MMTPTEEQVAYIFKNYSHLMTIHEKYAWKYYMTLYKHEAGQEIDPEPEQEAERKWQAKLRWLNNRSYGVDKALTQKYIELGSVRFHEAVAKRILEDSADQIFLNRCAKCGSLARTPQAQQCPKCYHSWHDKSE